MTTKSLERPELSGLNASAKATTTTQTSPTEDKAVVSEAVKPSETEGAAVAASVTPAPPATPAQINGNNNEPSIVKEGGKQPKELPSTTSNAEAAAEAAANNGNSIEEHKQKKLGNDTTVTATETVTVTQHSVTSTDTDNIVTISDTNTDTDTKTSTGTSQKGRPVPVVNRHSVNNLNKNPFEDDDERIYEVPAGE